jgi:hypothetical protein
MWRIATRLDNTALIYGHPWYFCMRIRYFRELFFGPYLLHITRSACTLFLRATLFFRHTYRRVPRSPTAFTQSFPIRCQFHQHFTSIFFMRKLYSFFCSWSLAWYFLWRKKNGGKTALKMLVKLTTAGRSTRDHVQSWESSDEREKRWRYNGPFRHV